MINIIDDDYSLNDNFDNIYANHLYKKNFEKNVNTSIILNQKIINKKLNTSIISKNKLGSISFTKNLCDLEYNNKRQHNESYDDNNYIIENKKYKNK